jgi:hypothetical protein
MEARFEIPFGASGGEYGAPGIGSGEPYNTQLAVKIIF